MRLNIGKKYLTNVAKLPINFQALALTSIKSIEKANSLSDFEFETMLGYPYLMYIEVGQDYVIGFECISKEIFILDIVPKENLFGMFF